MRGDKADYVQLGTRIPPRDYQALKSYYQARGMLSKVIRVLVSRHLKKLAEADLKMAQGLQVQLEGEVVTALELKNMD